jgi:hypothetical protein
MNRQAVISASVIFDRDHGTENEGWYVRLHLDDGQEVDCQIDQDDEMDAESAREHVESEASGWGFACPAGIDVDVKF